MSWSGHVKEIWLAISKRTSLWSPVPWPAWDIFLTPCHQPQKKGTVLATQRRSQGFLLNGSPGADGGTKPRRSRPRPGGGSSTNCSESGARYQGDVQTCLVQNSEHGV